MDIRAFKTLIKENVFIMKVVSIFYNYLYGRNKIRVKGRGNRIDIKPNVLLRNNKIIIDGSNNKIEIDNGSRLANTYIYIWGEGHLLKLGKDVIYKKGTMLLKDKDCVISFGDGTTVEDAYLVAIEGGKISIGKDCMVGHEVDIRNGDSHSIVDLKTNKRLNPAGNIGIGDHVWLGAYSQILKAVTIGDGSIVGLRSVVTSDMPRHCICVGVPAKVAKEGVTWTRERLPF